MYNTKKGEHLKQLNEVYLGARTALVYLTVKQILTARNAVKPTQCDGLQIENPAKDTFKVRTTKVYGSKRGVYYVNHAPDLGKLLNLCKIDYEVGNDAPRGGKQGNFIWITPKDFKL